jgi:Cu+-exporting ATPase
MIGALGHIIPPPSGPLNKDERRILMPLTYTDPVCGMEVTPGMAAGTSIYQGETYYFCSLDCMETFEKDPERYVKQETPR